MIKIIKGIEIKTLVFVFLLLCMFFLPMFEAPKNWFWGLFVFSCWWLSEKDWNKTWLKIDALFLLWVIMAVVSGALGKWLYHFEFNFFDVLRFVLLGWCVSKLTWMTDKRKIILLLTIIISTLMTFIQGLLNCPEMGECIELNSVGHVNHSAIYMLLVFSVVLSALLFMEKQTKYTLLSFIVADIVLFVAITITQSRAAFLVMLLLTGAMLAIKFLYIEKKYKLLILVILSVILAIMYIKPPEVVNKIMTGTSWAGESPRKKLRRFSHYVVKQYPVFGIGFGNFSRLKLEDIKDSVINEKGKFDEEQFLILSHAHSLYYTYLISGGIIMLTIMLMFFLYVLYIAFSLFKYKETQWLAIAGGAVVVINLVIGIVNTTLHHEHAMLSMVILGLLIAEYRRKISENTD